MNQVINIQDHLNIKKEDRSQKKDYQKLMAILLQTNKVQIKTESQNF